VDRRRCRELIEKIREINPDCAAARMCDQWHRICLFPSRIDISFEPCEACKDLGSELHECYCVLKGEKPCK
jgi:hypothetical protein